MPYVSGAVAILSPTPTPGVSSPATTTSSATASATNAAPAASSGVALVRGKSGTLVGQTRGRARYDARRVAVIPASDTLIVRRELPMPKQGIRRAHASLDAQQQSDELGSWLSSAIHGIGHAATQVGHTVGKVVTSKVGQAVLGGALAVTGVGLPAAAAIFGGTKAVGNLIKPGGNLAHAATGLAQGAVEGAGASLIGRGVRAGVSAIRGSPASAAQTAATVARPPSIGTTMKAPPTATIEPLMAALPPTLTPSAPAIPTAQVIQASPIGAPAGASVLTLPGTLPANPVTPPTVAGTAVRVASQSGAIPGFPGAVLQAGRAGSGAANKGAADARMAAQALQAAAAIAAQSGQSGLASSIANIAGTVSNVGATLQTASGAIQGAATGAVAGAQTSVIQQWIGTHKGLVYGGAAGVGLLVVLAVLKPRSA